MTTGPYRAVETPNVERWTRLLGELPAGDEHVVLVPPQSSPGPGLEQAERLVRAGRRVRLVMRGATTPAIRARLAPVGPVALTEIDAYLPGSMGPVYRELVPGIEAWLRSVFAGSVEGIDGARAFWASSAVRLSLPAALRAWCLARGIVSRHGHQAIFNTDPGWIGAQALESLLAKPADVQGTTPTQAVRPGWRLRVVAFGIAGAVAAIALRTREFVSERRTRAAIHARNIAPEAATPRVWLGVIGYWPRIARHVIGPLGRAARARGERVGVLLQSSLRVGNLGGAWGTPQGMDDVLPALASPDLEGIVGCVDQCVSYETYGQAIAAIAGTLWAMARVCRQLARAGPELDLGPFRIKLRHHSRALAIMTTLDVLRAREAAAAASRFAHRRGCRGLTIAWPHASMVSDVVPDLVLQGRGALTLDVGHGMNPDLQNVVNQGRTFATISLLWTAAEARYIAPFVRPRCLGGIAFRELAPRAVPRRKEPVRVLVLSNYALYYPGFHGHRFTQIAFQEILLDALREAVSRSSFRLDLRWRPHPSDDPESIEQARRNFSAAPLALSRGREFDEDLQWADVVVTSISSTVVEAVLYPVSVLIHDIPYYEGEAFIRSIPDCRRFRDERDLPFKLERAVRDALADSPLAPEAEMRAAFFGESGTPSDIAHVVFGFRGEYVSGKRT